MKKNYLISILAALSILSGYLMSKVSLVGKAGMSFFYTGYNFLKIWWQGGLTVFITLLVLLLIQGTIPSRTKSATLVQVLFLLVAFAGLYLSFYDFRHTLSHRWLGERFHLGVYLFWIGWMMICLYYLLQKKNVYNNTL